MPAGDGKASTLEAELVAFGPGPVGLVGSARTQWFVDWLKGIPIEEGSDPAGMSHKEIIALMERRPDLSAKVSAKGNLSLTDFKRTRTQRLIQVAAPEQLASAMHASSALEWDEEYALLCGRRGLVVKEDIKDQISKVKFPPPQKVTAWLPSCALENVVEEKVAADEGQEAAEGCMDVGDRAEQGDDTGAAASTSGGEACAQDGGGSGVGGGSSSSVAAKPTRLLQPNRMVRLVPKELLKAAVADSPSCRWFDKLATVGGKFGVVLEDDVAEEVSKVRLPPPASMVVWLPTAALLEVLDKDSTAKLEVGHGADVQTLATHAQNSVEATGSLAKRRREI